VKSDGGVNCCLHNWEARFLCLNQTPGREISPPPLAIRIKNVSGDVKAVHGSNYSLKIIQFGKTLSVKERGNLWVWSAWLVGIGDD